MSPGATAAWVALVVTLGIAIVGWARANRADMKATRATEAAERSATAAEQSAEEARHANQLARDANDRADRAETRATTRNDVQWDSRVEGNQWRIFNKGADDATDVIVILRAGETTTYDRVEVGSVDNMSGAAVIDVGELRAAKQASNQAAISSMSQAGIFYAPSSGIPLHQRILWTDAAGTSHTTEETSHNIG